MKYSWTVATSMALGVAASGQAETTASPTFEAKLNAALDQLVKPDEPGQAICVASDGKVSNLAARGLADLERRAAMTVDTPVYIASLGKGFTTVAILKLVEENRLSLDDRVAERVRGLPAYMAPVTVRHLLTHTSGVADYDDGLGARPGVTNADVLAFLRQQPGLTAPAGSKWSYSNAGFVVLAELFAAVAGERLDQYVTRTFFQPLGMTASFFPTLEPQSRGRAIGYRLSDGSWKRDDYAARNLGPGGIYSSARDLCTWGLALDSGKVLKRMTLAAAYVPHVHSGARPTPMGLGFQVEDIPKGPLEGEWYAALFGNFGGFQAVDMRLKSRPFRYVQLSNSGRQMEAMLIPDLYFEKQSGQ